MSRRGQVLYDRDGHVVNVFALDIVDGSVQAIRCVVNPDKLRHLDRVPGTGLEAAPETSSPAPAPPGARRAEPYDMVAALMS